MNAGRLKHLITIQRFTSTKNDFGEVIESWSDLYQTRAEIKPITAREYFASNQNITEMTHKITIRYQETISPVDRILFDGKVFDITSVANISQANRVIEILAKENI